MSFLNARTGFLSALLLTTPLGISSAQALDLTPVGLLSISTLFGPPGSGAGTGFGYGGMLEQTIDSNVSLETGFIYLTRKTNQGNAPSVTYTYYYDEIPLMVRIQPNTSHFSFGIGGYYAWAVGNFQSQSPSPGGPTYTSYEAAQLSRQDYGVIGAFGFRWPLSPHVQLYSDIRFALGLKNIELIENAQPLKWRDYFQAVGGITLKLF